MRIKNLDQEKKMGRCRRRGKREGKIAGIGLSLFLWLCLSGNGIPANRRGGGLKKAPNSVEGGSRVTPGMRRHPERYFPVYQGDDSLKILKGYGFQIFDDVDHHRQEIQKRLGLNPRNARLEINIPRRCFWVAYHFWKRRDVLRKFLPPRLMRSLFDMEVIKKDDEMGGILCLRDVKTGKLYLGFGIFTLRRGYKTDNRVSGRRTYGDYVALKAGSPRLLQLLKEVTAWIVPRKKDLTRVYWEPVGEKLVKMRNAKL